MATEQISKRGERVVFYTAEDCRKRGRETFEGDRPRLLFATRLADDGPETKGPVVTGRALVFDTDFPRFGHTMRVASGSLNRYMRANKGTMGRIDALYNHDNNAVPYASTQDGTLRLRVDKEALHYEFDLDLDLERHRELAAAMKTGRIDRSSASFYVLKEKWDDEAELRTLTELDFTGGEISVVRVPANPAADATIRTGLSASDGSAGRLRLAEAAFTIALTK